MASLNFSQSRNLLEEMGVCPSDSSSFPMLVYCCLSWGPLELAARLPEWGTRGPARMCQVSSLLLQSKGDMTWWIVDPWKEDGTSWWAFSACIRKLCILVGLISETVCNPKPVGRSYAVVRPHRLESCRPVVWTKIWCFSLQYLLSS